MADPFSDYYWSHEFAVTAADMERLAQFIKETQGAHDLTILVQRIVRGRLRYGADLTDPVLQTTLEDTARVRLWDPAASWQPGDRTIVAIGELVDGKNIYTPYVGEVVGAHGNNIRVQIDALDRYQDYKVISKPANLQKWRDFVENLVATRHGTRDEKTQIEYVLLQFGEQLVSEVLTVLKRDTRFIELSGRWFLRELAVPLSEIQLTSLAWALLPLQEPQLTAELVPLVHPPLQTGDPGLFGLYMALRQRPEIFENVDPGLRPRWQLIGSPPGSGVAQHAAYDPETYEVLCVPGETMHPEQIQRLWNLDLLSVVV